MVILNYAIAIVIVMITSKITRIDIYFKNVNDTAPEKPIKYVQATYQTYKEWKCSSSQTS